MFEKLALVFALAPLVACATQPQEGTALAELSGQVRNERTLPITNATTDVALVWVNSSGTPDVSTTASVQVSGTAPTQFQLSIYDAPTDAFLNDWDGVKVGIAYIVAYDPAQAMIGIDEAHVLVYVPQDVPAGSAAAGLLHSTPSAGFHVYGVQKQVDTFDKLVPAPSDLNTQLEIDLVDDAEQLDPPNWT